MVLRLIAAKSIAASAEDPEPSVWYRRSLKSLSSDESTSDKAFSLQWGLVYSRHSVGGDMGTGYGPLSWHRQLALAGSHC